jgi:ribosome-associated protein
VTRNISIDESELEFDFVRASGPGGQHVNKAATAVQLRFAVAETSSLPDAVRRRLMKLAQNRITKEGVLIIEASEHRSQHRNRREAIERLKTLVRKAARKPKKRRKTRAPQSAKERRLREKRRRSETKQRRKPPKQW